MNGREESKILSVSCFDTLDVRARVTFDSYKFEGISVTCWMNEGESTEQRIDTIFDLLFEEMAKTKGV